MKLCTNICPRFQTAVEILGRRWVHLIVQVLTRRPHRFGELAAQLEAVSERMLSERLKELVAEGIVERRVIPETPVQVEYRLTEKGKALEGVLDAVSTWAERWVDQPESAQWVSHDACSGASPATEKASAAKKSKRAASR